MTTETSFAPDSATGRPHGVQRPPMDASSSRSATSTGQRIRRFVRTPKGTLLLVFAALLGVAGSATGWPLVGPHVLAAVAGACLVELAVVGLVARRLAWPSSALLSGLIVAFVLGPDTAPAVTLLVAGLATAPKHLVRT